MVNMDEYTRDMLQALQDIDNILAEARDAIRSFKELVEYRCDYGA